MYFCLGGIPDHAVPDGLQGKPIKELSPSVALAQTSEKRLRGSLI
jgi:hypothetical protein